MSENQSKKPMGRGGPRPGSGRPKGSLDKGNALIRQMIVESLDMVGGVEYLCEVARTHPSAYLSLVGKVMPVEVTGEGGGAVKVSLEITGVPAG
jgi:hypothetical protein